VPGSISKSVCVGLERGRFGDVRLGDRFFRFAIDISYLSLHLSQRSGGFSLIIRVLQQVFD
jgi:hypothetical protein